MENLDKDESDSDESGSDYEEQEDRHYTVGGKQGFNTNIDDFLSAFGTIVNVADYDHTSRATRSKALAKGPLLRFGTSFVNAPENTQTDPTVTF